MAFLNLLSFVVSGGDLDNLLAKYSWKPVFVYLSTVLPIVQR